MNTATRFRSFRTALLLGIALVFVATTVWAGTYPPPKPPSGSTPSFAPQHTTAGPIFSNTHSYAFGIDPAAVVIRVDVYDNYFGDFTKYQWVYTVKNNSFEPSPGSSNGFSGFELALPAAVPDLADVSAPDGIPPWIINGFSGSPVEWDLRNTDGAPVAGGTLPGQTEIYSFTSAPRLITQSTGWFHTWQGDGQTDIVNYPAGDGPECPDVLSPPNQVLCCYQDATGAYQCQLLADTECRNLGGVAVNSCNNCPPITPTERKSWGKVKTRYR